MKTKPSYFTCLIFALLLQIFLVPAVGATNKIMPVGDSITQGSGSEVPQIEFWVSYRKALYDRLKPAGYVVNGEIFVGTLISGDSVADFDPDHDGHPGWRADEIVDGRIGTGEGKLSDWLIAEEPNIVLLHIGTNDVANGNEDYNEIEDILVEIDDYESTSGNAVWVILALIIDRSCDPYLPLCPKSAETTAFNNDVEDFVFFPRHAGGDKIILVDMQNDAGINYQRWYMGGDMEDDLHPIATGFAKMADLWFTSLMTILPQADAGPDQDVDELDTVILDASGSFDPKGGNLSYQWIQMAGTPVVLSNDQAIQPTFDAPVVAHSGEILNFKVTVTNADDLESSNTVNITVLNDTNNGFLYTPVTPCRIVDTRNAGVAIPPGGLRSYEVYGNGVTIGSQGGNPVGCPLPQGEPRAVQLNVTVVPVAGQGHLRLYPFNTPAPIASALNYSTDAGNISNAVSVKTCYLCMKDVVVKSYGGTTHVVLDVMGYHYPAP